MGGTRDKIIKRALARKGMYSVNWLINKMHYSVVKFISPFLIFFGYLFTGKHRAVARESLEIAFGKEKSSKDFDAIIKRCFKSLGKGMIELLYFQAHEKLVIEKVEIVGKEHLDQAIAKGKGVIGVSAHFGVFPLMFLRIALAGYNTTTIRRVTRDPKVEDFLLAQMSRLGLKTIYSMPRNKCVKESIRVLRDNGLLFMLLDQNAGTGGIFVDFFGHQAATSPGAVVFAKRTQATILPMFIVREKDDKHKIIIEPPFDLEKSENEEDVLKDSVARITKIIEKYVRKYPHEWSWMHRRWKSRPVD